MDTLFCAPDTSARSEGFRSSCEAVDDGGGGENALLEVGSAEVVLASGDISVLVGVGVSL